MLCSRAFQTAAKWKPSSQLLRAFPTHHSCKGACDPLQGRRCSRVHTRGSATSLNLLTMHLHSLQRQHWLLSMVAVHRCSLLIPSGYKYTCMLQGQRQLHEWAVLSYAVGKLHSKRKTEWWTSHISSEIYILKACLQSQSSPKANCT